VFQLTFDIGGKRQLLLEVEARGHKHLHVRWEMPDADVEEL
jgi:hypothetical protein